MTDNTPKTLRELLEAPKGNINYRQGDAFLLHVFWEAPSLTAAQTLLGGLNACANATHRDTPCVPTYFFRISNNDSLCSAPPRTVSDHPHLQAALKKTQLGVPGPAVRAELVKRGLDPDLLDLAPDAELPPQLQQQPVRVEFTEIYLDERAFIEHAGSRDYLNGHGVVMNPALHYTVPSTLRMGTPPAGLVERILEPVLREIVAPLPQGCYVWRRPDTQAATANAIFLSIDVAGSTPEEVARSLPPEFHEHCTTCVTFAHPLCTYTTRLMCVLLSLPPPSVLSELSTHFRIACGEAHVNARSSPEQVEATRVALEPLQVSVNATESVGYVYHEKATQLHPI